MLCPLRATLRDSACSTGGGDRGVFYIDGREHGVGFAVNTVTAAATAATVATVVG